MGLMHLLGNRPASTDPLLTSVYDDPSLLDIHRENTASLRDLIGKVYLGQADTLSLYDNALTAMTTALKKPDSSQDTLSQIESSAKFVHSVSDSISKHMLSEYKSGEGPRTMSSAAAWMEDVVLREAQTAAGRTSSWKTQPLRDRSRTEIAQHLLLTQGLLAARQAQHQTAYDLVHKPTDQSKAEKAAADEEEVWKALGTCALLGASLWLGVKACRWLATTDEIGAA